MKNLKGTWIVKDKNGNEVQKLGLNGKMHKAIYWGKLKEVIMYISLYEFKQMETIEFYNPSDGIKHRPITKEQVEKMLEEMN